AFRAKKHTGSGEPTATPSARQLDGLSARLERSTGWKIKTKIPVEAGRGFTVRIECLFDAGRAALGAFAGAGLLLTATRCLATRALVDDQLRPITSQQERFEIQLNSLHLERRLVLDSSTVPTFAFGSAALTQNAKREIDQFFGDLEGSTGSASRAASERVFV